MLEIFTHSEAWVSLLTLTVMEIVLGIDNIIFISILTGKLPVNEQAKARGMGLFFALFIRIALLFAITWIIKWDRVLFSVFGFSFSPRDLIMLAGGLFLLAKSTIEIHNKLEGEEHEVEVEGKKSPFMAIVMQILLLDIVFSFDSIITAIGLAKHVEIMIIAVIISMVVMLVFSGAISRFINRHPTMKMLALSFLLMIGLLLMLEGFKVHVEKGYVYFAMAFAIIVEILNLKLRKKSKPVNLKQEIK